MKSFILAMVSAVCVILVSGCASNAALRSQHTDYRYNGEKYGKVVVTLSDSVSRDARKGMRLEEMLLDRKILAQLKAEGLYDESSQDSITVLVNSIYIRNAFNAVMFGFMAGADSLKGAVTLNKGTLELATFDVNASYALGGIAGGQNQARLGWLSDKFAEQAVKMILGKK